MMKKLISRTNYGASLTEVKTYLRLDTGTVEDTLLNTLITGSYKHIANSSNRDYTETEYDVGLTSASYNNFISLQEVDYANSGSLRNEADGAYLDFTSSFTGDVRIRVATSASMPEDIKMSQLLLLGHWYDNRNVYVIGANATKLDLGMERVLGTYTLLRP
jgi:hypothetical protein